MMHGQRNVKLLKSASSWSLARIASVASKDKGVQNVQQLKVLTQLCRTLYTITSTRTELLNDTDNTVVISCYCLNV